LLVWSLKAFAKSQSAMPKILSSCSKAQGYPFAAIGKRKGSNTWSDVSENIFAHQLPDFKDEEGSDLQRVVSSMKH